MAIFNFLPSAIGGLALTISWLIDTFLGAIILIQGYFLQMVLAINMGVVNSPMVRVGFPIALSFANLAFVLGIIVIAIATILNIENYGMKSLLWKLLVMAIAINFGLIIAGSILRISDNITLFFVNSALPGGAEAGATGGTEVVQLAKFGATIAGAFNPQRTKLFNAENIVNQQEIRNLQMQPMLPA